MDPGACPDLRFLSGAPFKADLSGVSNVADVRYAIGLELTVTPDRIRLISCTGEFLNDADSISCLHQGTTTACVLSDPEDEALAMQVAGIVGVSCFGDLRKRTVLHLNRRHLLALPGSFGQLVEIRQLHLQDNRLAALPERFGQLVSLQSLRVDYNQLAALPEEFGSLASLEVLRADYNHLRRLPDGFGRLRRLQQLYLNRNRFNELPESFGELVSLKFVWLQGNDLEGLPAGFGQLASLHTLFLQDNLLVALPESFTQLRALKHLRLDHNRLRTLPTDFGQLEELQFLYLNQNQLTALPESFCRLSALRTLWLHGNALMSLPKSCSSMLTALEMLWLQDVQLTRLLQRAERELQQSRRSKIVQAATLAALLGLLLLALCRKRRLGSFRLQALAGDLGRQVVALFRRPAPPPRRRLQAVPQLHTVRRNRVGEL